MTCTGVYKFALSSPCGTIIQARQTWPTVYAWQTAGYVAGGSLAVGAWVDGAVAPATTTRYFRNPFCGTTLVIVRSGIYYSSNNTTNTIVYGSSQRSDAITSIRPSFTNTVIGSAPYTFRKTYPAVWTDLITSESMFYISAISTSGTTGRMHLSQQTARPANENEIIYYNAGGRDFR